MLKHSDAIPRRGFTASASKHRTNDAKPLIDADRAPRLAAVREHIEKIFKEGQNLVVRALPSCARIVESSTFPEYPPDANSS